MLHCNLFGAQRLILAHIGPCRLDARDATLINRLRVSFTQLKQCLTCHEAIVQCLGPNLLEDFRAQGLHLRDKLRSHLLISQILKLLQTFLVLSGPDHREAVSVLEKRDDHASDPVLVLNCV